MKHKTLLNKLLLLVMALTMTSLLPAAADDEITEGWYYITNTTKAYNGIGKGNALYVNNGTLTWYYLNENDPAYIFKLEKSTDGKGYYLYNLGEDSWYKGLACLNTNIPVNRIYNNKDYPNIKPDLYFKKGTDERKYLRFVQTTLSSVDPYGIYLQEESFLPQTFYQRPLLTGGQVDNLRRYSYVYPDKDYADYYIDTPLFGVNYTESNTRLHVTLQKVTDSELQSAKLKLALTKAETLLNNNSISTLQDVNLLTNADQLSSLTNCTTSSNYTNNYFKNNPDEIGVLGNLLEDKTYESVFSATGTVSSFLSPSYINMDLGKTVNGVQLEMKVGTSNDFPNAAVFPTDITIFGTTVENQNAESTNYSIKEVEKNTNWTKIGDFKFDPFLKETDINYQFDGCTEQTLPKPTIIDTDIQQGHSETKNIIFPDGKAYRYLRIYVNHTTIDYGKERVFQLSGLQLKELSDITATHGLQNDIETLRELIVSGNKEIREGTTVSDENVTNLETAINNLSERRTVTISSVGYATFVSDVNVILPTGLTAYYVTAKDNNIATLSEVVSAGGVLPAGTPVLLKGEPKDDPYILYVATGDASISEEKTNLLEGSATENKANTDIDDPKYYTLQNKDGSPVFMKYSGTTLKAGYAYLPVSTSASPAFLNISFDATTGIQSAVNGTNEDAKTYDLEGRSVKHPQKGIYIQNGKKVVIK